MGWITNAKTRAQAFVAAEEVPVARWWLWFFAIVGAGTVLRFWNLGGAPIWMDEAVTLAFARLDFGAILWEDIDNHPSLTWVIQRVWYLINPDTSAARVPVAFFGSLSVAALMLAARDILSARAAIFVGLLFAFSTGHIYFSQDARMYPYVVFGLILALWGALGHVVHDARRPAIYAALYIIGGGFAIYSHIIGLIAMALIGFSGLAGGLLSGQDNTARLRFVRAWLLRNVILFVFTLPWLIAIPGASGTFPGLADGLPLSLVHWYYRNVTGFPGLANLSLPFEAILYALATLSIPIAWLSGRKGLALLLAGLIIAYPLVIMAMHLRQPIFGNRIFLPSIIGVTLGAGYALSRLKPIRAMTVTGALLAVAAFISSAYELAHRVKLEDFPGAYAFAEQNGFDAAPTLTCVHFQTAAAWEARRQGRILYIRGSEVLHYKGPEYWQAARMGMSWLRAANAREIDAALGGGWLIEGGLEAALSNDDQVIFIRAFCPDGYEEKIEARLAALGFRNSSEANIQGNAADFVILEAPSTRITLYAR